MALYYRLMAVSLPIVVYKEEKMAYQKKHNVIVCVDSDGCVMDTMNLKHEKCFGPFAAEVFQIADKVAFQQIWERINLYSATRGTNRFKGLILALEECGYTHDFSVLKQWVETTPELSNRSLSAQILQNPSPDLQLALQWSEQVNAGIKQLKGQDHPFDQVQQHLAFIRQFADVAVVSAANNEAIMDEWTRHNLLPHVDVVFGQEQGSKAACLNQLKQAGFAGHQILMVGDSPGDLHAAELAGTHFFPILCRHEQHSWHELVLTALGKLVNQDFDAHYQQQLIAKFQQNLTA